MNTQHVDSLELAESPYNRLYSLSLELVGEQIDDGVIARIFAHKPLRELHIVDAGRVTDAGLNHIRNVESLEWLNLDGVSLNENSLQFIEKMKRLKGLLITNSNLAAESFVSLMQLKKLKYLSLDGSSVDDKALKTIAKLKKLKTLRLASTKVTDKGVTRLLKLKKLQTLVLFDTAVTATCAQTMTENLTTCEIYWAPRTESVAQTRKPEGCQTIPAHFFERAPKPAPTPSENYFSYRRYLEVLADAHKWRIDREKLSAIEGPKFVTGAMFRSSQPPWIAMLDWCSNS